MVAGLWGSGCVDAELGEVTVEGESLAELEQPEVDLSDPAQIRHYPGQFGSLQQAVDATPHGGVLRLTTGTFFEGAVIVDKTITISGKGTQNTVLDGTNLAAPLISLGQGGGVVLKRLTLRTGHTAIQGGTPNGGRAQLLQTSHVAIEGADVAIAGAFEEVVVRNVSVASVQRAGVALRDTPRAVFRAVTVDCGEPTCKAGLYLDNSSRPDAWVSLREVDVVGGSAGGVAVLGGQVLRSSNVSVTGANVFGFGLFGVPEARLDSVSVLGTNARPDGAYGDGFLVWASDAEIMASDARNNARTDILAQGCSDTSNATRLELAASDFGPSPFFLAVARSSLAGTPCAASSVQVIDAGGNVCYGGDASPVACAASATFLAPIELPSPP